MVGLRLGLQIVEHVPPVHALVARATLVHLAVRVVVARPVVFEDALVEDGGADAVQALFGRSADPRCVLAGVVEEEPRQGLCLADGALALEVLEFSISEEAADSGDSSIREASSLLLGPALKFLALVAQGLADLLLGLMGLLDALPLVAPEALLALQVGAAVVHLLASPIQAEETGLAAHILALPNGWRHSILIVTLSVAFGMGMLVVDFYCLGEGNLAKE